MTEHGLEIIGIGLHPSQGLRKGVVINIETTVNSLKKAVEEASLMAGCEIPHGVHEHIRRSHQSLQQPRYRSGKEQRSRGARPGAGDRCR
jgi:cell division ATPase FtsA